MDLRFQWLNEAHLPWEASAAGDREWCLIHLNWFVEQCGVADGQDWEFHFQAWGAAQPGAYRLSRAGRDRQGPLIRIERSVPG